ncbi:MAG: RNA polymerase sigma factor [Acidimicrobiia bacterium]
MDSSGAAAIVDPSVWLVEMFASHADSVFNVAYRIVWNRADAQDVVQDTFIKAVHRFGQLSDPAKARGWLLAISYREALMVLRRRRDHPTDPSAMPELADAAGDPATVVVDAELAELIRTAIDKLPDLLRVAFVLRDVEEMAMSDVADTLGIGLSAAKMRVGRAREHLRVELSGRI